MADKPVPALELFAGPMQPDRPAAAFVNRLYLQGFFHLLSMAAAQPAAPDDFMKTDSTELAAEKHYARVVRILAAEPDVAVGAGRRKGFGASALSTHAKIFAMLSSRSRFVVKLPKARVDLLVAAGQGTRFDPGHGRLMKEWLEVAPGLERQWLALAREAQEFVAANA